MDSTSTIVGPSCNEQPKASLLLNRQRSQCRDRSAFSGSLAGGWMLFNGGSGIAHSESQSGLANAEARWSRQQEMYRTGPSYSLHVMRGFR